MCRRFEARGVTGTPGTSCSVNSFLTLSWTPGADEHQGRGGRIEGEHVVAKPMRLHARVDLLDLNTLDHTRMSRFSTC